MAREIWNRLFCDWIATDLAVGFLFTQQPAPFDIPTADM